MNLIYDETDMRGYRISFNTILGGREEARYLGNWENILEGGQGGQCKLLELSKILINYINIWEKVVGGYRGVLPSSV